MENAREIELIFKHKIDALGNGIVFVGLTNLSELAQMGKRSEQIGQAKVGIFERFDAESPSRLRKIYENNP